MFKYFYASRKFKYKLSPFSAVVGGIISFSAIYFTQRYIIEFQNIRIETSLTVPKTFQCDDIYYCYPLHENPAFLLVHCRGSIFNDHPSN